MTVELPTGTPLFVWSALAAAMLLWGFGAFIRSVKSRPSRPEGAETTVEQTKSALDWFWWLL